MNEEQKNTLNQSRVSGLDFAVVGIGASAGGLRALTEFLEHLPSDAGLALAVILHLSPKHESNIGKLQQRATRMPVTQVDEPIRVERNNIYVISPAVDLVTFRIRFGQGRRSCAGSRVYPPYLQAGIAAGIARCHP